MSNQVAVVTGGTNGVGRALADALLARGVEVFITGRNDERLENTALFLRERHPAGRLHTRLCDQLELAQTRTLAEELRSLPRLDLLLNNAAVCPDTRVLSREGYEQAFTVNYLAHYLLTRRLESTLRRCGTRVVHVSSSAMGGGRLDFSDLHGARCFDGWRAYSTSKLAQVLFSSALAEAGIDSIALCPGMVDSGLIVNHRMFRDRLPEIRHVMRPAAEAAEYVLWAAMSEETRALRGVFFSKGYHGKTPMRIEAPSTLVPQLLEASERMVAPWLEIAAGARSLAMDEPKS